MRRLALRWQVGAKDRMAVLAMAGLPALAIAGIVWFALGERARAEQRMLEAANRRAEELHCLAENIYFEARGEPLQGQYAVAEVTLNRLRSRHFPNTICEVVHEKRWDPLRRRFVAHFSWTELGSLPEPRGAPWKQAKSIAVAAYDNANVPVVPNALFFHATSVHPYWAGTKKTIARIGNHIFYR